MSENNSLSDTICGDGGDIILLHHLHHHHIHSFKHRYIFIPSIMLHPLCCNLDYSSLVYWLSH